MFAEIVKDMKGESVTTPTVTFSFIRSDSSGAAGRTMDRTQEKKLVLSKRDYLQFKKITYFSSQFQDEKCYSKLNMYLTITSMFLSTEKIMCTK